ncbi:hypothetical protein QJQ45_019169 [Haematococcus lacustris]|nr:hypothetical protein QJQ45_019169 [Haematococcus lacustris]
MRLKRADDRDVTSHCVEPRVELGVATQKRTTREQTSPYKGQWHVDITTGACDARPRRMM